VGLTIALGITCALCWGAPSLWLAQASRSLGPLPVLCGSILVGLVLSAPVAAFVDAPHWTTRGVLLAVLLGPLTLVGYVLGFTAFRTGAVAIVAPIIACEGGLAAVFAIAGGERPRALVGVFLALAMIGVVLASMGHGGGRSAVLPALGSAVVWGGVLALTAPAADDLGPYWAFLLSRLVALAFVAPIAFRSGAAHQWLRDRWRVVAWGVGDTTAYLLFFVAADRGPVSVAGVLVAQFATVAAIVGTVFGGERLLRRQVIGVVVVIAAISGIAAVGSG
jgi:drug/metabolite transporter (DMT)-like permease